MASPEGGYNYLNINSNATTVVKKGRGVLVGITVNTAGASANTVTIYDNTAASGTKIGSVGAPLAVGFYNFGNLQFTTGLTIVTATGTAPDMTVVYA